MAIGSKKRETFFMLHLLVTQSFPGFQFILESISGAVLQHLDHSLDQPAPDKKRTQLPAVKSFDLPSMPEERIELSRPQGSLDFESSASTCFTTPACFQTFGLYANAFYPVKENLTGGAGEAG